MNKIFLVILFLFLLIVILNIILYVNNKKLKNYNLSYQITSNNPSKSTNFFISGQEKEIPIKSLSISGAHAKGKDGFCLEGKREAKLEIILEDMINK